MSKYENVHATTKNCTLTVAGQALKRRVGSRLPTPPSSQPIFRQTPPPIQPARLGVIGSPTNWVASRPAARLTVMVLATRVGVARCSASTHRMNASAPPPTWMRAIHYGAPKLLRTSMQPVSTPAKMSAPPPEVRWRLDAPALCFGSRRSPERLAICRHLSLIFPGDPSP
jgi:hypothetical protein